MGPTRGATTNIYAKTCTLQVYFLIVYPFFIRLTLFFLKCGYMLPPCLPSSFNPIFEEKNALALPSVFEHFSFAKVGRVWR